MITDSGEHSLWLLPSRPDEKRLQELIQELSAEFGTPCFQPHLTLLGDVALGRAKIKQGARQALTNTAPINAQVLEIGYLDEYFRSFFLRMNHQPALLALYERSCQQLGVAPDSGFMPHISLLYGPLQLAAKKALQMRLMPALVRETICFDRVAVVRSAKSVPIHDWTVLDILALQ